MCFKHFWPGMRVGASTFTLNSSSFIFCSIRSLSFYWCSSDYSYLLFSTSLFFIPDILFSINYPLFWSYFNSGLLFCDSTKLMRAKFLIRLLKTSFGLSLGFFSKFILSSQFGHWIVTLVSFLFVSCFGSIKPKQFLQKLWPQLSILW